MTNLDAPKLLPVPTAVKIIGISRAAAYRHSPRGSARQAAALPPDEPTDEPNARGPEDDPPGLLTW
jgi:hypothetical protein